MVLKLKETEKRLYETVQEKQDMESRLRASQKTLEDIQTENERQRRQNHIQDEEQEEIIQELNRLRQRCADQTQFFDQLTDSADDLELQMKQLIDKVK